MIQESIERLADLEVPPNPFPGLRPFEFLESYLFFGREDQSERLIEKLARRHFLAVIGTSGSGKSSLVRAGLLPALIGGMMRHAGAAWRVALLRPGNDPLGNLAAALNSPDAFGSEDEENRSLQIAITETTLRRGNLGLIEAVRQARMPASENLIVIADQFEELFRVGQGAKPEGAENDKAAFVKLLLEASRQRDLNIYVVLTMRSDYLGDCAQFWDLPEAINESQYLIPRLTYEQRRAAITGPANMGGAEMTPRLVNRLMNDVGDNPDQLPILQHALMCTWDNWKAQNRPAEPVDLRHYKAIGGMSEALSRHADKAYNELPDGLHKVAEKIFKALTEKGPDNREIRRPIALRDLCETVAAPASEVVPVIEAFRRQGRSFLMPPADSALTGDTLIDISHESLIRVWTRLSEWVEAESRSARQYQRLAETAMLHEKGKEGLLRDPALQVALNWRRQNEPNPAWARRYHPDLSGALEGQEADRQALEPEQAFERAMRFLDASERQRAALVIRRRLGIAALILLSLVAIVAAVFAFKQKKLAEQKTNEAVEQGRRVGRLLYVSDMNLAQKAFDDKDQATGYELLNNYLPAADARTEDLRDFGWYYLWRSHHDESAVLQGHEAPVISVAFSPDGKLLASGSRDTTIKLWEAGTGKLLDTLQGHAGFVSSVVFSPDGKLLASGGDDKTIKLWEVGTGKLLNTLQGHAGFVSSVAFSPDGKVLVSGSRDTTIKLWEVSSGKLLNTLQGHAGFVSSVVFSPDGKLLASGGDDKTIKLWEVSSGKLLNTLQGHEDSVSSVAFSPDGKVLASAGDDKTIKLWEVSSGKLLNTLQGHEDSVYSVVFSPDGKLLASGGYDKTIKLWEVSTGTLLDTLQGHANSIPSVTFSPDGKLLASGSWDKTIKLWKVSSGRPPNTLQGHTHSVSSVVFSPDGKLLASGSRDNTIKLWEVNTGKLLNTLQGHTAPVYSVVFSPDGKLLASGGYDKTIKLWEVSTGKLLNTLQGHTAPVLSVAFSPDGKLLASGGYDKTIKLWEVSTGKLLNTLQGHTASVLSVAFSPDGKLLASGSGDKTIKLWEVSTGKPLDTLQGHSASVTSVAFSPDGKVLASGGVGKSIDLWEVNTGRLLNTLQGHADFVYSVAFSPDGRVLASGGDDHAIKLWEVSTGKPVDTLQGHTASVSSVAFSPDGKVLASGSEDDTVRLFFAATDQEVAAQRSH
jgi:WD40 repeat protein